MAKFAEFIAGEVWGTPLPQAIVSGAILTTLANKF
jgi:hypothetical protein